MQVKVYNTSAAEVGKIKLDDAVFGCEYNEALIHQAVVAYQAKTGNEIRSYPHGSKRGRHKAVETERHRTCPSGLYPRSAMDEGRRGVRTQAERFLQKDQQENEGAGFPQRDKLQGG